MGHLEQGVTLEVLLEYVERAACGDRKLLVGLYRTLQGLAHHPSAPPEDRLLGEILSNVLMGDRTPDLTCLPEEIAAEVEDLLQRLRAGKTGA